MINTVIPVNVKGHVKIVDDLGNVLVDKDNAVHPQNMARIFARALTRENNHFIRRIAFGNGGTSIDAALTVTYNPPNDGQPPDIATWDSRLYNETYSEVMDFTDAFFKQDPGSADINTGVRTGGAAAPASDPASVQFVSGPGVRSYELGLTSQVVIECVLNASEPQGQFLNDTVTNTDFVFDEIGLYTAGAAALDTVGYQQIDIGDKISTDNTGLLPNTQYEFRIAVDGGTPTLIRFQTPVAGGTGLPGNYISYGDLCRGLNSGNTGAGPFTFIIGGPLNTIGASVLITDYSGAFAPELPSGTQTYGFLTFQSSTSGVGSSINLNYSETLTSFLPALNPPFGGTLRPAVPGVNKGIQNDPLQPLLEQERLLAHLTFSPVLKAKNRTLTIIYTLTISVARSPFV